ncbi:SPFH domain-containing protein [[Clostridium] symbiosum]|uniref:SPFH domain-containing protein n=1 Tax=Clostridium symbiosum TaxID=1512 RepID=UPI001D07460F|nr:SPFH domain-containing protein [[Clostridium] symbiosum]MCB6607841.1 SPFH domain-containing protein [[Clostridium] symbiosum]MCB6930342.1 SPFH domain-containing protein [[Clostridium] symbiosum]
MGIIKAVTGAIGTSLADQWLEVIEAEDMSDQTVFTKGVKIRSGQNKKGLADVVSNGSIIHVYPNQFMMLVDGGKVVDYTAEEGYYKVDNSAMPSLFNGEFGDALKETFNRIRFGGQTPLKQVAYFINLQEIKGIRFGTRTPINYFDNFYNAELFLRAHGTYSIKVTEPLKFYAEVIPKNEDHVDIDVINEQYLSEFLSALQSSINQMSSDGTRISYVSSKSRELGQYMSTTLDAEWNQMRGMEIQAVGIASISYDEESQKLINMRNQGAMLGDPSVREGYVQGSVARGMEAAGSNANGSLAGFMGMGVGMNAGGGLMGALSAANMQQMQMNQAMGQPPIFQTDWMQQAGAPGNFQGNAQGGAGRRTAPMQPASWTCACGTVNTGKFCSECGTPKPSEEWTCSCGNVNKGNFCSECGKPRP